ncbi:MAG: hypothetical protein NZT92_19090 [Abditibacteriales bacterium]|nr:hypothetical protein [Abditibacteriales bacterium]MDW8367863.1 hypothetical protein [Abditibacteriales bacterium]
MRWRQVGLLAVALLIGLGVIYKMTRSSPPSDRELILELIETGKQAIERKSPRRAMRLIAEDYSDDEGNNYRALQRLANQVLTGARQIQVTIAALEIQHLQPPDAIVRVAGIVALSDVEYTDKHEFDLTLYLVKRNGAWKVRRIEGMKITTE